MASPTVRQSGNCTFRKHATGTWQIYAHGKQVGEICKMSKGYYVDMTMSGLFFVPGGGVRRGGGNPTMRLGKLRDCIRVASIVVQGFLQPV